MPVSGAFAGALSLALGMSLGANVVLASRNEGEGSRGDAAAASARRDDAGREERESSARNPAAPGAGP